MTAVIPTPRHVTPRVGSLALDAAATAQLTQWACAGAARNDVPPTLSIEPSDRNVAEGYALHIDESQITVRASDDAGVRHAAQTLRQLLPVEPVAMQLPATTIDDAPWFAWRGMHVDVSRHWFPLDALKRFIDTMMLHKFNVLHWHLTDDQGWRIEIESWPRLTEVGAWREESPVRGARTEGDGTRYGGFYTQADVRELVAYAAQRGITIVPEIDLPGHMQAAIAAYPDLGHGEPPQVHTRWGVSDRILNVKDETLAFLDDVLAEVCALFPGPHVHLGGDEVPTQEWQQSDVAQARLQHEGFAIVQELQGWLLRRMGATLARYGKRSVAWDEVLACGAPKDAIVMAWRDAMFARAAAGKGHDVVLCPMSCCYFDHYQGPAADEPEAIGGNTDWRKVLAFQPTDETWSAAECKHLLGVQGNLWTEYIHDAAHLEYMAWPRGSALAEIAWIGGPGDAASFASRWPVMAARLDALGVLYRAIS